MAIAFRTVALTLAGLGAALLAGCATEPPPAPVVAAPSVSSDQLVGKWGFAAYHRDTDRARTIKEALAQCNRPYVVAKGPTGGVMMNLADQATLSELVLKAGPDGTTYLGPPGDAGTADDRIVTERRRQFLHDQLGRPGQRKPLWHLGVRALRSEEGVRRFSLHLHHGEQT